MTDTTQQALATFQTDVAVAHSIVHGDATTTVTTLGGPVRSFAKLISDNQAQFTAMGAGTNANIGTLAGTHIVPVTDTTALKQTTLQTIAQWVVSAFLGVVQAGSGAVARAIQNKATEVFSVKDFGAKGDGIADDTLAIQAAVSAAVTLSRALMFPDGTYNLSAAIVAGTSTSVDLTGLRIFGQSRGGTILNQTATNTPIFTITGRFVHSLTFSTMRLQYATMQSGSNASVFMANTPTGSMYNCVFQDITAASFNYFMTSSAGTWWGNTYRDMWLGDCTGGINSITGAAGEPNCRFERMYITCQSATQVLFNHNAVTAVYDGIEVNQANSGATMIYDAGGGAHIIGHWALEGATYNASATLFNVPNSILLADFIYTETLNIGTGVAVTAFACGGSRSYIDVRCYGIKGFGTNNGTLIAIANPGPLTSRFRRCLLPYSSSCQLLDVLGTVSAEYVIVEDWNDPTRTSVNGDADVTLTQDAPLQQIFDVPLTAARNVNLPQGTASTSTQMFTGRRFRIVKSNTSAYALNVKDSNGTLLATIAAGNRGIVELVWHRSGGAAGWSWIITDQRTY